VLRVLTLQKTRHIASEQRGASAFSHLPWLLDRPVKPGDDSVGAVVKIHDRHQQSASFFKLTNHQRRISLLRRSTPRQKASTYARDAR